MEGVVTITPTSPEAETYVNDQRIYETTMLQHGTVVRFGRHHTFRFCDPQDEDPVSITRYLRCMFRFVQDVFYLMMRPIAHTVSFQIVSEVIL